MNSSHPPVPVRIGGPTEPLHTCFHAFGYANADYTTTAPTRRMYDWLSAYHVPGRRYMRLHNILTLHGEGDRYFCEQGSDYGNPDPLTDDYDRVFSYRDGELVADWTEVDAVYDQFLAHGFTPIVETHHLPSCLMDGSVRVRDAARRNWIPRDYRAWGECIRMFTEHVIERYGRDEVREWYFEVWNEPDGCKAFKDDYRRFFALYDHMEHAVHAVDEEIPVGGPATMQHDISYDLFEAFLGHCADGVNHATGRIGSRVDFLSVHCKGGFPSANCPSTDAMFTAVQRYLEILDRHPRFARTPFFNDESDIIWCGNRGKDHAAWLNFRSTHYFPGFVCKMVDRYLREVADRGVDLRIVDSDNCHQQWERGLFSGNRAQLTPLVAYPSTDLVRKAAYNAYPLLARLRPQRLNVDCDAPAFGDKFGCLATGDETAVALMAWHFEDGMEEDVPARQLSIQSAALPLSGACRLVHWRIDRDHSNAYQVWKDMGMPSRPDREQIMALRRRSGCELAEAVRDLECADGRCTIDVTLPMHAVSLLLIVPAAGPSPTPPAMRTAQAEDGFTGERQVFVTWHASEAVDLLHYRLHRSVDDGPWTCIADGPELDVAAWVDMTVAAGHRYAYRAEAVSAGGRASGPGSILSVCA